MLAYRGLTAAGLCTPTGAISPRTYRQERLIASGACRRVIAFPDCFTKLAKTEYITRSGVGDGRISDPEAVSWSNPVRLRRNWKAGVFGRARRGRRIGTLAASGIRPLRRVTRAIWGSATHFWICARCAALRRTQAHSKWLERFFANDGEDDDIQVMMWLAMCALDPIRANSGYPPAVDRETLETFPSAGNWLHWDPLNGEIRAKD